MLDTPDATRRTGFKLKGKCIRKQVAAHAGPADVRRGGGREGVMNHRPQAPQPVDGDVVITCASGPEAKCSVRQLPADPQFTVESRAHGVRLLRNFARHEVVDLWSCDAEGSYLIEHNRRAS